MDKGKRRFIKVLLLNLFKMKITIELTEDQVKGLKSYLKEVSGDITPKINKQDIKLEIQGIIDCNLQTGAVYDHIKTFEK